MESMKRFEVGKFLSSSIPLVSSATPISKVIGVLKESNAYEVFFEDNEKTGMVTTRDILRASSLTTAKASTLGIFVPKLIPQTTIGEAARLMMEYRIRALPVYEKNALIGVVQALRIVELLMQEGFSQFKIKDIMTRNPVNLAREDLVSKARGLMIRRKIDHLPVLNGNELEGLLTSSGIVFNMFQMTGTIDRSEIASEKQKKLEFPVRHLMETDPLTCEANDSTANVLDEMVRRGATCSIVTLWREVQGIITYRDYMKLLAEQLITDPSIYIVGLPDDPLEAEMAKSKFIRTMKLLKKSYPSIEEAKAVIKTFTEGNNERRRYEVSVSIITPKRTYAYSEQGWELPVIFDNLSNKLKKMVSRKPSGRSSDFS